MPDQPLALLRRLVELMKVLVSQLRELCLHVSGHERTWCMSEGACGQLRELCLHVSSHERTWYLLEGARGLAAGVVLACEWP